MTGRGRREAVPLGYLAQPIMVWRTPLRRRRRGERPRKDEEKLATFLTDLSPSDMQRRLGDALAVYVDVA
jgi:hypothetical protein